MWGDVQLAAGLGMAKIICQLICDLGKVLAPVEIVAIELKDGGGPLLFCGPDTLV